MKSKKILQQQATQPKCIYVNCDELLLGSLFNETTPEQIMYTKNTFLGLIDLWANKEVEHLFPFVFRGNQFIGGYKDLCETLSIHSK